MMGYLLFKDFVDYSVESFQLMQILNLSYI